MSYNREKREIAERIMAEYRAQLPSRQAPEYPRPFGEPPEVDEYGLSPEMRRAIAGRW